MPVADGRFGRPLGLIIGPPTAGYVGQSVTFRLTAPTAPSTSRRSPSRFPSSRSPPGTPRSSSSTRRKPPPRSPPSSLSSSPPPSSSSPPSFSSSAVAALAPAVVAPSDRLCYRGRLRWGNLIPIPPHPRWCYTRASAPARSAACSQELPLGHLPPTSHPDRCCPAGTRPRPRRGARRGLLRSWWPCSRRSRSSCHSLLCPSRDRPSPSSWREARSARTGARRASASMRSGASSASRSSRRRPRRWRGRSSTSSSPGLARASRSGTSPAAAISSASSSPHGSSDGLPSAGGTAAGACSWRCSPATPSSTCRVCFGWGIGPSTTVGRPGASIVPDTLEWGLWPFIVGDLSKLYVAAVVLPGAWDLIGRRPR